MALSERDKQCFLQLQRAGLNDDLVLIECKDNRTGKLVSVIATVHKEGKDFIITPFGALCDGNPYDVYDPPVAGEGGTFASGVLSRGNVRPRKKGQN